MSINIQPAPAIGMRVEHAFADQDAARSHRRILINLGRNVSLIGYDGDRDVYAFDEIG